MEDVSVIVLSVCVTGQSEQTGDWDDQNCRTVEWVHVSRNGRDRIGNQCVASDSKDQDERPKAPIYFKELIWEEVLPLSFFQF